MVTNFMHLSMNYVTGTAIPVVGLLVAGMGLGDLAAQTGKSVRSAINPSYTSGGAWSALAGQEYRSLWASAVDIPILELTRFAGGLEAQEQGGGMQTRSLRFRGGDGREYNFRSANKFIGPGLSDDLRGTPVQSFLQDQVSSLHPAAALIATPLLDAAGVPNPRPRLVALPDSPLLGDFRAEFAGMIGTIEVHPNETEDEQPDFAGAVEVDGADDVLADADESPRDRLDARGYLRERLISMMIGDWDRHAGQYRWARWDVDGVRIWSPVPEDRDFAFSNYDGALLRFAGALFPQATAFDEQVVSAVPSLTQSSAPLDRRVLGPLTWSDWEEILEDVKTALNDEVIRLAASSVPPEYQALSPNLARTLIARREQLPAAAALFYQQLTRQVDLHATHSAERVVVTRHEDGSVQVELVSLHPEWHGDVLLDRTFGAGESDEIRVHLAGGDGRAEIRGSGRHGPLIRVIGGEGDDWLVDQTDGSGVWFHDAGPADQLNPAARTRTDQQPYDAPSWVPGEVRPPPDWGSDQTLFSPWAGYDDSQGLLIGGGPVWTTRGFRRLPYARRVSVRAMFSPTTGDFGVDATVEWKGIGRQPDFRLQGRASEVEAFRFHGYGNATVDRGDAIHQLRQLRFRVGWDPFDREGLDAEIGVVFERLSPDDEPPTGSPLSIAPATSKAGLSTGVWFAAQPERQWFEGGWEIEGGADGYVGTFGSGAPFAKLGLEARGYLPMSGRSLLALRVGGSGIGGEAPFYDHVTLGGSDTVRGLAYQRLAGDAEVHASVEIRAQLFDVKLLTRSRVGFLTFADVGRIVHGGDLTGGWRTGTGAGLWLETLGTVASATYADGEDPTVYLKVGMPF